MLVNLVAGVALALACACNSHTVVLLGRGIPHDLPPDVAARAVVWEVAPTARPAERWLAREERFDAAGGELRLSGGAVLRGAFDAKGRQRATLEAAPEFPPLATVGEEVVATRKS